MIKKYSYFILLFTLLLGVKSIQAQNPISLYYMENIPQSMLLNPALTPRANGYFGIPLVNNVYTSFRTDLSIDDFLQESNGAFITPINKDYNFDNFYRHIGKAANIDVTQVISPFMIGWRTKQGYFNFGITAKAQANMSIPKDLFGILDKGLPNNSSLDLSPLGINLNYYNEISMTYAHEMTPNFSFGVTGKVLFGIANVHTDFNTFDVNTSSEQWDFDMDGALYSSIPGLNLELDEDGNPSNVDFAGEFGLLEVLNKFAFNVNNPGFAVDLGAYYDLDNYWTFSASLTDLGFLSWKGDLNSVHFKGQYTWEGLEIDGDGLDDIGGAVEQALDSLQNSVNTETKMNQAYKTFLSPKLYLGSTYNVNHYFNLGFLSKSTFAKNNFQQEFNLSANLNLYHFLTTTVNYSVALDGRNNLGFGMGLRFGPLQFFTLLDYIPYSYRYYNFETSTGESKQIAPDNIQAFNVMFGFNLIFGANGYRDEPMIEDYVEF